jgi:DNA excision repair protein ERCC-6
MLLTFRDAINPYMLQRFKKDVEMVLNLPDKSEQILFCDLTPHQRSLYTEYLKSKEIKSILVGRIDAFVGLINLRKLCNHPDLITGGPNRDGDLDESEDLNNEFGAPCRSGKLIVMESLLKLWFKQKQKVLLFSQSRQMLVILEKLVIVLG